jgi:hypothetical protein
MVLTTLWISKPLWIDTKEIAVMEDRSAASVVRQALTEYLNRKAVELSRRPTKRRK